jgi:aminoglycoside phosphotransferase (APT) family kinase protein
VPEWSAEVTVDEALARRLIAAQCFEPRALRLLGVGWDNTVWLADERWAFRFPRRELAVPGVYREIAVLDELALPLPIPTPRFVGVPSDEFPWPWFGAERIVGAEPLELTDEELNGLGRPLGAFLRALHDSSLSFELPVDPMGRADMPRRVHKTREALAAIRRPAPDFLDDALALEPSTERRVVHGDLHLRHLLVDAGGRLAGVIDWGDVCRGDPAIDLPLVWSLLPPDGRADFFAEYGRVTEAQLLRARVLALFMCAVLVHWAGYEGLDAIEREARAGLERASR